MASSRTCSSGMGVTLLLAALPAAAQERATTPLEEIIVTATKRGEVSVQDIPAGVSAISGDFLESQSIRTLEDTVPIAGIWLACTALIWLGWAVAR